MMSRLDVRSQVLNCSNCQLNAGCTSPVPFKGPSPARLAVLGEAPTSVDDACGKPFSGKAGELLHGLLADAGFEPDECMWVLAVACIPLQTTGRLRSPLIDEINACSDNRAAQLRLADPQVVLLVGNVPLGIYRPDMRIGVAHGRAIRRSGRTFFPIFHPEAALRNPAWIDDIRADLSLLTEMESTGNWTLGIKTCVKCGRETDGTLRDKDGITYCPDHRRQTGG